MNQKTFFKDIPFYQSSATRKHAEEFLLEKFDWDRPKSEWRAVVVSDLLEYFGLDNSHSSCSIYGIVISKLNGRMTKRSNGVSYTWLPPLKSNT